MQDSHLVLNIYWVCNSLGNPVWHSTIIIALCMLLHEIVTSLDSLGFHFSLETVYFKPYCYVDTMTPKLKLMELQNTIS